MLKRMQTYSDHSDVSVNLHRLILHQVGQPIQQTDKKNIFYLNWLILLIHFGIKYNARTQLWFGLLLTILFSIESVKFNENTKLSIEIKCI